MMIGGRGSEQEGLVISTKNEVKEIGNWEIAGIWETLWFRLRDREMFLGMRM